MKLDDIHRPHCQTGAVYHAADTAIQRDIVELPLRSVRFTLVFLRRVVHRLQLGLAIQGIGINHHLGIEAVKVCLVSDDERIHLNERQVLVRKKLRQPHEDGDELLNLHPLQAQPERQIPPLIGLCAHQWVDLSLQNLLGGLLSNLLDFDAAFGRRHKNDATAGPIHNRPEVEFISNIGTGLDQNSGYRLATGICLVGDQALPQPLRGELTHRLRAVD